MSQPPRRMDASASAANPASGNKGGRGLPATVVAHDQVQQGQVRAATLHI